MSGCTSNEAVPLTQSIPAAIGLIAGGAAVTVLLVAAHRGMRRRWPTVGPA